MGVTTQFLEHDASVGSIDTLPEKLRRSEISHAALHVFNNFVEQIARATPPTATMKMKRPSSTSELRRSARFVQHVDPLQQPQVHPITSCFSTRPNRGSAHKVCTLKNPIPAPILID